MTPQLIFIQIDDSLGWDKAPAEFFEAAHPQTARDTIKAIANLLNKKIRISYPDSVSDNPANLNGHYIDPKFKS